MKNFSSIRPSRGREFNFQTASLRGILFFFFFLLFLKHPTLPLSAEKRSLNQEEIEEKGMELTRRKRSEEFLMIAYREERTKIVKILHCSVLVWKLALEHARDTREYDFLYQPVGRGESARLLELLPQLASADATTPRGSVETSVAQAPAPRV